MSFSITRLDVRDFRSFEEFVLEPDEGLTILVGPNATGKTNLVEALELVTEADSFRNPQWADLVRWGADSARITLHACDAERRHDVEMTVSGAGRRAYRVAGKPKRSISDVRGTIPCVVFTPEDLRLVKDSAERRRAVMDSMGTQLSPGYARLRTEYDRVVRQRNTLLKQESADDDTMAPWDERLVSLGARVHTHRKNLFERVAEEASVVYGKMAADGPLTATYVPSWVRDGQVGRGLGPAEEIERHLASKRTEERARGVTLSGPHRDEMVFGLAGREARAFASQGQQRTIALAFKLAEVAVVAQVSGSRPVLLLDDVMSELDETRRHALARFVGDAAQTVITTANLDYFSPDLIARAKVVRLP